MTRPLNDRLREIEVLILDVDGVLTDGRVIYSDAGHGRRVLDSFARLDPLIAESTLYQLPSIR